MRTTATALAGLVFASSANAHEVAVVHTHMGMIDTIGLSAVVAAAVGAIGFYLVGRNAK